MKARITVEIPVISNTGNGCAMTETWERVPARIARNGDVLIETNRGWSRPAAFRAMISDVPCMECGGDGVVDSGGVTPWGASIDIPCPSCVESAKAGSEATKGGRT